MATGQTGADDRRSEPLLPLEFSQGGEDAIEGRR